MLFRALGIPARYTVGFFAEAKSGESVDVTAQNAHAWVEVYVDNIGWVYVEVTGSPATPETITTTTSFSTML
jgi:transglutaminase-like putative cysteine protease